MHAIHACVDKTFCDLIFRYKNKHIYAVVTKTHLVNTLNKCDYMNGLFLPKLFPLLIDKGKLVEIGRAHV